MPENLLVVCATAFVAVIVLLTALAGVIHLITSMFPPSRRGVDAPLVAAIEGAVIAVSHDRWFLRSFEQFLIFDSDGEVTAADSPERAWV